MKVFFYLRAPEVIIGHPYDSRIDIWSVGAVLAELYTGYVLFQNDSVPTMLSRISGIMGPFPRHVLQNGKDTGKYFTTSNIVYERDEEGTFHLIFPKQTNLTSRLHFHHHHGSSPNRKLSVAERKDEELFIDFVRAMLNLDPSKRFTAAEALQHPWLSDADTIQFKEYIIGQPAQPPQHDDEDNNPDIYLDDDEADDQDDESDEAEMNKALYYAKYTLPEMEEDDVYNEDEEGTEDNDSASYEKSTCINGEEEDDDNNGVEGLNALTADDDLVAYENEFQNSKEVGDI